MAQEILNHILDWCFKNTNILEAKENDNNNRGFLHFVSENGYDSVITKLLAKEVQIDAIDDLGFSPLHLASSKGHVEVARTLVQNGAIVHRKSFEVQTPLHLASINGHTEMVHLLIAVGSNVNTQDGQNWTSLHHASINGFTEVAEILLNSNEALPDHQSNDSPYASFSNGTYRNGEIAYSKQCRCQFDK